MQTTLTRSQPLTNKAPRPSGAKPLPSAADKGPIPIENGAQTERNPQAGFTALANALRYASHTDEPHSSSGDSDRLLRIAADVASEASDNPPEGEDAERRAFDIAALTIAALRVPGDTCSPERFSVLQEVKTTLQWLTDCEDVLQEKAPPHLTTANGFNAKQFELILETIAGKARTAQQLLMLLQSSEMGEQYTQDVCLDAITDMVTAIGAMADQATGGGVIGDANCWFYGPNFDTTGKAVQA